MTTDKGNIKQKENKNLKKARFDREEFGHGYDLSPDDLDIIGQNNAAKTNTKKAANHPVNNDKKNDQR
ncbi:hypothetical protein HMPREF1210_02714 [Paenisporosarcina sp. HGH0030]|uniref:hypothetical protein n=1 Tax=Paenisporosarcina sp. HGH0030 TaxID=1078085 RepID=UPI00034E8862|nr:hypothetical protein [Paenisporosarcina sp. HGH0030]EPD50744.1 hypothetical protein HMPREF1210_02714 [Paenisporosarcina sp. HGH0030]